MDRYVFWLEEYELKTPFTIIFKGSCSQCDRKFVLEYCSGSIDVKSNTAIPDRYINQLENALEHDYGYGPYNKEDISEKHKCFHRYGFR